MSNTNIYDSGINPVLEKATNDDLAPLVGYIEKKFSQDLTLSDAYKKYRPDHQKYYDLIAKEIRDMGGNSFVNLKRGEGPTYREVVYDVGKKVKANVQKGASIQDNETAILEVILEKAVDLMSDEEKSKLFEELDFSSSIPRGGITSSALITLFRAGGFKSYQLTVIIANQMAKLILGKSLPFVVNTAIVKQTSILMGPVGWVISGVWTAVDLSGPAYSVTIPCVIHIAMLRIQQKLSPTTRTVNVTIRTPLEAIGTSNDIYIDLCDAPETLKPLLQYMDKTLLSPTTIGICDDLSKLVETITGIDESKTYYVRLSDNYSSCITYSRFSKEWGLKVEVSIDGYLVTFNHWFVGKFGANSRIDNFKELKVMRLEESVSALLESNYNRQINFDDVIYVPRITELMDVLVAYPDGYDQTKYLEDSFCTTEPDGYEYDYKSLLVKRVGVGQYCLSFKNINGDEFYYQYLIDNNMK